MADTSCREYVRDYCKLVANKNDPGCTSMTKINNVNVNLVCNFRDDVLWTFNIRHQYIGTQHGKTVTQGTKTGILHLHPSWSSTIVIQAAFGVEFVTTEDLLIDGMVTSSSWNKGIKHQDISKVTQRPTLSPCNYKECRFGYTSDAPFTQSCRQRMYTYCYQNGGSTMVPPDKDGNGASANYDPACFLGDIDKQIDGCGMQPFVDAVTQKYCTDAHFTSQLAQCQKSAESPANKHIEPDSSCMLAISDACKKRASTTGTGDLDIGPLCKYGDISINAYNMSQPDNHTYQATVSYPWNHKDEITWTTASEVDHSITVSNIERGNSDTLKDTLSGANFLHKIHFFVGDLITSSATTDVSGFVKNTDYRIKTLVKTGSGTNDPYKMTLVIGTTAKNNVATTSAVQLTYRPKIIATWASADTSENAITLTGTTGYAPHTKLIVGDIVKYSNGGSAAIKGVTHDALYKIKTMVGTTFTLVSGATSDSNIATTAAVLLTYRPVVTGVWQQTTTADNTLTLDDTSSYVINDKVTYTKGSGAIVSGLTNNAAYKIKSIAGTKVTLVPGATSDANVAGTAAVNLNYIPPIVGTRASITASTNTITLTGSLAGLIVGNTITYSQGGGSVVSPLVNNVNYKIKSISGQDIVLTSTAGVAIDLNYHAEVKGIWKSITASSNTIELTGSLSSVAVGDTITYSQGGGAAVSPLVNGVNYQIKSISGQDVTLKSTAGVAINLNYYPAVTGTWASTTVSSNKIKLTGTLTTMAANDAITYVKGSGVTVSPLVDGTTYYVKTIAGQDITLAATSGGSVLNLNYHQSVTGTWESTTVSSNKIKMTGTLTTVAVGDSVTYTKGSGVAVSPLVDGTAYFIKTISGQDVTLAATSGGSVIDLNYHSSVVGTWASTTTATNTIKLTGTITTVAVGDSVTYTKGSGVAVSPLVDGTAYFIKTISGQDVTLAATSGGTVINLNYHSSVVGTWASITTSSNTIKLTGTLSSVAVGDSVTYAKGSGVTISPLADGTSYKIKTISGQDVTLESLSGIAIVLNYKAAVTVTRTAVDATTNQITLSSTANLVIGDSITFSGTGSAAIDGLTDNTAYVIKTKNSNAITLQISSVDSTIVVLATGSALSISALTNTGDTFTVPSSSSLSVNDVVLYKNGGSTSCEGLTTNTRYKIQSVPDSTTFTLKGYSSNTNIVITSDSTTACGTVLIIQEGSSSSSFTKTQVGTAGTTTSTLTKSQVGSLGSTR
jgi:hypothetical protein